MAALEVPPHPLNALLPPKPAPNDLATRQQFQQRSKVLHN
jgi:hypothetical protein